MTESQVNLNQIIGQNQPNHKYELRANNESAEDAIARRVQEAADADLRRQKDFILFWFALIFVTVIFFGCVYLFASGGPDDKKWAAGIVSAIVSGLVGFLVGQGKK